MESTLKFQRGDIYFVRLDSSTGSEQNGTRPAVILQNDVGNTHSPTLIVATLTSKTEKKAAQPTHCLVEPEKLEPSIVQAEQIFTIDKSRVQNFVGHLTPEEMSRVDDAVKISLALNPMGSMEEIRFPHLHGLQRQRSQGRSVDEVLKHILSAKGHLQAADVPCYILKITIYRSDDTMVDKFSQVAGNVPVTNNDPNRRYTVINGYPVVLNFAKEPNPGVFERVRDILLATSYTKKTS